MFSRLPSSFYSFTKKRKQTKPGASTLCKWEKVTSETISQQAEDPQAALANTTGGVSSTQVLSQGGPAGWGGS